jgi:glycosyltransferase involved in cell wall biosynthesis
VANGQEAILVPAGEPEAMANAVRQLAEDPALRRRLSQAARSKAAASFSWTARAGSIVQVLHERNLLAK